MLYVLISTNNEWIEKWKALINLTRQRGEFRVSLNLTTYARLPINEESIVFIDAQTMGVPKYTPYNPLTAKFDTRFVLVNVSQATEDALLHYLKAGYSGAIEQDASPETVLKALGGIVNRHSWYPRNVVERAVRDYQSKSITQEQVVCELAAAYNLSKREQQICLGLLEGERNSEIGDRLYISKHTVKCHVTSLYRKLGVSSRNEILAIVSSRYNNAPPVSHKISAN